MKKAFTILTAILSLQGFSQGWAEVGTIWHYSQRTVNPEVTSYKTFESFAEDTIDGVPCKKIKVIDRQWGDTTVWYEYMYSENDSVFFYRDGNFHLLYDFGAETADSILLPYFWTVYGDSTLLMIIDSTSTIDINGEIRKLQYISCGDGISVEFGDKVIEGIGNTYYMFPTYDGEYFGPLRCYEDFIVGLFISPFHPNNGWNFEDCDQIITWIPELESNTRICTFPNPFTTVTTLSYTLEKPENVHFTVYNLQSQIVYTKQIKQSIGEQQVQWNAEGLPAGMYYFRIQAGSYIGSGKIIKMD